jgi:exosortase
MALDTVALTLCVIGLARGKNWLKQLAFPVCLFLVAVPWPTPVEQPIIQSLTRMSAAVVIESVGWLGVPAVAHGNVIEIGTGMVGIDEACSGIRSFQSSLMISLFLGEFYLLSTPRRLLLIILGFLFSMAFNVCRMGLLTVIAANKGIPAISRYHDPAGVTITICCTLTLWGLAVWIRNHATRASQAPAAPPSGLAEGVELAGGSGSGDGEGLSAQPATGLAKQMALILIGWLVLAEAGIQLWYYTREAHLKPGPAWTLAFPRKNPTLQDLPIPDTTRNLLRYDEGSQASWVGVDGTHWQGFYFSWLPGRVAGYLAKRHTPEICMVATGCKMISGPELSVIDVHGVDLPIRSYVFEANGEILHVFHCRWEAGVGNDAYVEHESARYNLIRAVWAGRGNKGQKVMEFIISGMDAADTAKAKQALIVELNKLIQVRTSNKA